MFNEKENTMASIIDFLNTETGKDFIQKSGKEVNESPEKVKSVLAMALPMIMGAIKKNTNEPEGAAKLNSELEKTKHDGSILDNIKDKALTGFMEEGSGIIGHIFGGSSSKIAQAVSSATGMDTSKVTKIIKMAAPVVLGILGKQKRKDGVDKAGISSLVGSVLGSNSHHDQSLLESFMDSDRAGEIGKDVTGKLFGNKDTSKGLGGFFKG